MDQPGKVANPARGQLNRENNIPLSPCVPENLVSRDGFSRPVPRQRAHLHTQAESGAYLRDSSRVPPVVVVVIGRSYNIFVAIPHAKFPKNKSVNSQIVIQYLFVRIISSKERFPLRQDRDGYSSSIPNCRTPA